MVTQHLYYCCAEALKVRAVNLAPTDKDIDPNRFVAVHDVEHPPNCWYIVPKSRVTLTRAAAIWAAKEELDAHDAKICQEITALQHQRDTINWLLECGDPENDGT